MKKHTSAPSVVNRRARFDYELGEDIVVGLSLTGPEVKAARLGHVQLKGAYVTVRENELWLNNASFSIMLNQKGSTTSRTVDDSVRRLLAHRKEIDKLAAAKKQGMTIVPTKLLVGGHFIKLVIALGKGKKNYDKRQVLKKRDEARDVSRELKRH